MLSTISEKNMHRVRWALTLSWLVMIVSLFYDPISPWLTNPNNLASPLRAEPEVCILVQGQCLDQQAAYGLGAPVFWGIVVPGSILILLVFGHELWRRICPLSFLSQIFRALGVQRRIKRAGSGGSVRYEVARVRKDSWLARNYPYLQFGWLFVGLCFRILFVNADRLALALWLLFTIAAAITVGYLYGGKSWCHYFCPMAPVQKIFGEPKGLFTSAAHLSEQKITQSMCREVDQEGKEKSACVACQSPCIDIDSERTYWEGLEQDDRRFLYYGYVGLVVGYFCYHYLYAGNWEYLLSGIWSHEPDQIGTLMQPGFYINGWTVPIPKLVAVPLTLSLFTAGGYALGQWVERWWRWRWQKLCAPEQIQHRIYTLCTFFIFNFFFAFAGRSWVVLLPSQLLYLWESMLLVASGFWLYQTWRRNPRCYSREGLTRSLRKQLAKLELDFTQVLDGRSLEDLNTDEVYVLAKVLPGLTRQKRYQAYKGVLKEAIAEGYVDTLAGLQVLIQMRTELGVSDDDHGTILTELGVADPELFNPGRLRSLENSRRMQNYRKELEQLLNLGRGNHSAVRKLREVYSITYEEETEILQELNFLAGHYTVRG
jgi:hypothetical protein